MPPGPKQAAAQLSAELEAKLLQRLATEWRGINYSCFKSALRMPVLSLVDGRAALDPSRWRGELRSLELSRALVLGGDWGEVLETLKREAVQQFVEERLSIDEPRHGPSFRRICRHMGVRTRGAEAGAAPSSPARHAAKSAARRVMSRVHKLLALAQSPNRHEAENAAMTARRLMIKFNLDAGGSRGAAHNQPVDALERAYTYRHLGPALPRVEEHDRRLAKVLTDYFFVESAFVPIYLPREGRRATVIELCGLEPNLLMAEHIHDFVRGAAVRLWQDYRREAAASPRERLAFLAGVMTGLDAKLASQNDRFQTQGLVWVPAPELDAYFRRRNPRLRHGQRAGAQRSAAYDEGSRAGHGIVLSKPVASSGGPRHGPPKALKA